MEPVIVNVPAVIVCPAPSPVVDDLRAIKIPPVSTSKVPVTVTSLTTSFPVRNVPAVTVRLFVIVTESANDHVPPEPFTTKL
jgi:hypothetical protein